MLIKLAHSDLSSLCGQLGLRSFPQTVVSGHRSTPWGRGSYSCYSYKMCPALMKTMTCRSRKSTSLPVTFSVECWTKTSQCRCLVRTRPVSRMAPETWIKVRFTSIWTHRPFLNQAHLNLALNVHYTSSASPSCTSVFALDHLKMRMSPFLAGRVTSASVPLPWTSASRSIRMNTAVSRSGESIMLMLPAVSLRFCSGSGKETKNDER